MIDILVGLAFLLGGPAYIVAFGMVLTLRVWLGGEGAGWLRAIVNTALVLIATAILVYLVSILNNLYPPGEFRRNATRNGLVIALSVVPYFIIASLGPWWFGRRGDPPPVASLTPQAIPPEEE